MLPSERRPMRPATPTELELEDAGQCKFVLCDAGNQIDNRTAVIRLTCGRGPSERGRRAQPVVCRLKTFSGLSAISACNSNMSTAVGSRLTATCIIDIRVPELGVIGLALTINLGDEFAPDFKSSPSCIAFQSAAA